MKIPKGFAYKIDTGKLLPQGIWCMPGAVYISAASDDREHFEILIESDENPSENYLLSPEAEDWTGNMLTVGILDFPYEKYNFSFMEGGRKPENPIACRILGREQYNKLHTHVRGCFDVDVRYMGSGKGREKNAMHFKSTDRCPCIPYEDLIMYTGHLRGLTMNAGKSRRRGTFKGLSERIGYLKNLGINALELMPVYEFEETGRVTNYWGYGEGAYYALKASYAYTDDPEEEFRNLVRDLHLAGIELILEFYFPDKVPYSYICNVLTWWVHSYHIDGFHLSGKEGYADLISQEPSLAGRKIFAADGGTCAYHDGFMMDIRKYLKGSRDSIGALPWQLKSCPGGRPVVNYPASHNGFTLYDSVSYEKKHNEANGEQNLDGTNYNESINYGAEGPTTNRKINKARQLHMRNALLLLMLSQGVPCILAGDECCNSQDGNNNAYCLDSEISWVSYENGTAGRKLREFTKKAIAWRKDHPVFHQGKELTGQDLTGMGYPDFSVHGEGAWNFTPREGTLHAGFLYGYRNEFYYVACNMDPEDRLLALPKLPSGKSWHLAVDTGEDAGDGFYEKGTEPEIEHGKMLLVKSKRILVLVSGDEGNLK